MFVVADGCLPTAELLRLDEPSECCAILPRSQGGPWGEFWRTTCVDSPEPPLPSGGKGDEYSFAVRPLTREVAAQYTWTWSLNERLMDCPPRAVHAQLGFPRPYIISPRWWTDVLATLPWQAMAAFDLSDLAAGLYRIFLLPRAEADGGTRAIVVADMSLIRRVQLSVQLPSVWPLARPAQSSELRRRKRLAEFQKHVERLPPLGEWPSTLQLAGTLANSHRDAHSSGGHRTSGPAEVATEVPVPDGEGGLFPHQERSVAWMERVEAEVSHADTHVLRLSWWQRVRLPHGALLAHPPGAGKTRCVAELLRRHAHDDAHDDVRASSAPSVANADSSTVTSADSSTVTSADSSTVVFAPAHLAQQWRTELVAHAGESTPSACEPSQEAVAPRPPLRTRAPHGGARLASWLGR